MIGQNNNRFYKEKEKGRSKQQQPQQGKKKRRNAWFQFFFPWNYEILSDHHINYIKSLKDREYFCMEQSTATLIQ